jgi:hypothetical protein
VVEATILADQDDDMLDRAFCPQLGGVVAVSTWSRPIEIRRMSKTKWIEH